MRYKVKLASGYIVFCKNKPFWSYAKLKKTYNRLKEFNMLKGCIVTCYTGTEDKPKIIDELLIEDIFNI